MRTVSRRWSWRPFLPVLCAGVALAAATPASGEERAAPPKTKAKGRIELTARLEPADLGPGKSGMLVVKGSTGDLHIYADGSAGLKVAAIPVPGVEYGLPPTKVAGDALPKDVSITKPHAYHEPEVPDPYPVWEGTFELKVPVTIGAEVRPGTEVGVALDYSGCDKGQCYDRQRDHRAVARLPGEAAPAPAPDAAPPASATPRVKGPCGSDAAEVRLEVKEEAGQGTATVTFVPKAGWHLYLSAGGDGAGLPIEVRPRREAGVEWGDVPALPPTGALHEPYTVRLSFTRTTATTLSIDVVWQGCDERGRCEQPQDCALVASFGPEAPPPPPPGSEVEPEPPVGPVVFPVVPGDPLGHDSQSDVEKMWNRYGWLMLFILFWFGVGLAFTPCVLPIIPITISVVAGGRADLPKLRLTTLLLSYVAGLTLAFGTLGLVASLGGASMSAAFESPEGILAISGLFAVLAFGMFGVYELQPPQWLMKVQGGAQSRGGSLVGAFILGAIAAVIASPCTAPVVAGILLFTAQAGNAVLGFLMFAMLGLGMGAVFFAAGSLNFLMRPGPWMVWVRYAFGVLLVGTALYYVGNSELLSPVGVLVAGFGIALLSGVLVAWHLRRKEGAPHMEASVRGFQVAGLLVLATIAAELLTKPLAHPQLGSVSATGVFVVGFAVAVVAWLLVSWGIVRSEWALRGEAQRAGALVALLVVVATAGVAFGLKAGPGELPWTVLRDVDHLKQEVETARIAGQPVVVDIGATWCTYCKKYEAIINEDPKIKRGFEKLRRLKIDVTKDPRRDLRGALGMPAGQPQMVFLDRLGRIQNRAYVERWYDDRKNSREALDQRLDLILGSEADSVQQSSAR